MGRRYTRRTADKFQDERGEKDWEEKSNIRPLFRDASWSPLRNIGYNSARVTKSPREQKSRKNICPRNEAQQAFMAALDAHALVFSIGPAGTGKTYLAVAKALEALEQGHVARIVFSRPAIEAGENLGFLPGDMEAKLSPYLRPLFDAMADRVSPKKLHALMSEGIIEIAPIAYMRGRTLINSFIVIDEAQNCTYGQLKMLLTRLGWHSTMVVTGDPEQSDLLPGMSGLADIAGKLESVKDVHVIRFNKSDVVRHPLVGEMLDVL